jgi:hypothetical protein
MGIETVSRWQLVRDVIVHKKTGVIVVQTGTNYLNWNIEKGNLVCVSSTFPEASLTSFVQQKKLTESTNFLSVQNHVDNARALGPLLVRHQLLEEAEFRTLLFEHWVSCTNYLLDPSAHLFWSAKIEDRKPEFIRNDRCFGEVILKAGKNSITVPTALRIVQQLKGPYRIQSQNHPDLSGLNEEERRIWMYLQSGTSLKQMFQDRDISIIPCYKFIFLLWLSGYISDSQKAIHSQKNLQKMGTHFLEKIPPEWVIPLCAGALIGVLLAPAPPNHTKIAAPEPAPTTIAPLDETLQKPAWSTDNADDINTEARRHRDDEDE